MSFDKMFGLLFIIHRLSRIVHFQNPSLIISIRPQFYLS